MNVNTIKDLHLSHKGEDFYVCANGPSILKAPLERMKGHICLGINYAFTKIPDIAYTFVQEVETFQKVRFKFPDKRLIIPYRMNRNGTKQRVFVYNRNAYYYVMNNVDDPKNLEKHDKDFSLKRDTEIFCYSTTTHSAIHIAAYMGAKNIFLIGCDYKPYELGLVHYKVRGDDTYSHQTWHSFGAHQEGDLWLKDKLLKHNINVINLSKELLNEESPAD